ncbi:hypothetical protein BofuT4_uP091270.1 [Botrytis cinerea T4]|uniref:Uncharacterized protein n=1 Tax=Botryotinia fuckeliana (strain T4) TaxID=999810 RepID=G2YF47_BOTF4|nr:hypothetical protein BofuT4_uP091270.1 [Botrytis cinerea T4]
MNGGPSAKEKPRRGPRPPKDEYRFGKVMLKGHVVLCIRSESEGEGEGVSVQESESDKNDKSNESDKS